MEGFITNIQRFSIHDGPGIRTTIFFKGCNLRCFWCHNPETLDKNQQLQIFPQKCIGCGKCVFVCPHNARKEEDCNCIYSREKCQACGKCAEVCYAEALVLASKKISSEELISEIRKDKTFYDKSGGGVTFSGGEPFLQKDLLKEIAIACKNDGISTAVETALNIPWETIEELLPHIDLFMIDIKQTDEEKHKKATGVSNKLIIENIGKISKAEKNIIIRIPVIPTVNDDLAFMHNVKNFVVGLGIKDIELLPYHGIAEGKYQSLDIEFKSKGFKPPSEEFMQASRSIIETE